MALGLVTLAAAGVVIAPGVAAASEPGPIQGPGATNTHYRSSDGGSAECAVAGDLSTIECALTDNAKDGNPVFVEWSQGHHKNRLDNTLGEGTTTKHFARTDPALFFEDLEWKVCTDKKVWKDSCSDDPVHYNAPPSFFELNCVGTDWNDRPTGCELPTSPGPVMSVKCARALAQEAGGLKMSKMTKPWHYVVEPGKVAARIGVRWSSAFGWGLVIHGVFSAVEECMPAPTPPR